MRIGHGTGLHAMLRCFAIQIILRIRPAHTLATGSTCMNQDVLIRAALLRARMHKAY